MKKEQQNFENEVLSRKKRYNPFFFMPLDMKDGAFEKGEQEKERDQAGVDILQKSPKMPKEVKILSKSNFQNFKN